MDFKQELLKRLDALAGQLGTTATYLWHVLVRQGIIVGISDAVAAVVCFVFAFIGYRLLRRALAMEDDGAGEWPGEKTALFIPSLFIGGALLLCGCGFVHDSIQELLNPEFYALQQILGTADKK